MNRKKLFKFFIIFFSIFLCGLLNSTVLTSYKQILLNTDIIILLATLIAGLFGFIIAVIPFSIQLLNQDNTDNKNIFLNKLMSHDNFNFYIEPMLNRFIKALRLMLYLFIFIFIVYLMQVVDKSKITILNEIYFGFSLKTYLIILVFYFYTMIVIEFFTMLKNIIRDLESLVFDFIQSKKNRL